MEENKTKLSPAAKWALGTFGLLLLILIAIAGAGSKKDSPPTNEKIAAEVKQQAAVPNTAMANAYGLCAVLDSSGALSEKCSVSGWNDAISITVAATPDDAQKLCPAFLETIRVNKLHFDKGWQVKIFSPFSGQRTIAICDLN